MVTVIYLKYYQQITTIQFEIVKSFIWFDLKKIFGRFTEENLRVSKKTNWPQIIIPKQIFSKKKQTQK